MSDGIEPGTSPSASGAWIRDGLGGTLSLGLILLLWYGATRSARADAALPPPWAVWEAFRQLAFGSYLGTDLWRSGATTLTRLMEGWALSLALGIPLGSAIGQSATVRALAEPWLHFYRPLPPLAYMGLVLLWFGIGEAGKLVLLVLSGLPPIIIGTATAMANVRPERIEGARALGLGRFDIQRHVVWPSALPGIFVSARIAFGAVFAAIIGAEMIVSDSGLAWLIVAANNRGATSISIAAILSIGVVALLLDGALRLVERRLVPWRGRA